MTLDEIPNDITRMTPSCFEPTIDYVVAKIPKWQFEKFPGQRDDTHHANEISGRSDGDGTDVSRKPFARPFAPLSRARRGAYRQKVNTALLREKTAFQARTGCTGSSKRWSGECRVMRYATSHEN